METILIATDFSSVARNATTYGFELARQIHAKVILFTAYQPPFTMPDSVLYVTPEDLKRNIYKQLLDEAEAFDPRRTVALQTESCQGRVASSIISAAIHHNASYIVAGMKEKGKEIRKYFGSTVTHLSKTSPVPLIVVPANAVFSAPKTLALASDITDETDIPIIEPLKKLGENFNSTLSVVRVIEKSMDEVVERVVRPESFKFFLASFHPSYEFVKSENVAKALNEFVKQHGVDMIAVVLHEHNWFERVFTKSVTKSLVFLTKVPLLILPFKKINEEEFIRESCGYDLYNMV